MATARSVFQLIDLDRTIFDTSAFVKALTDEIDSTEPGVGTKLDELFEAAYEKEQTFFLLRYLREAYGDDEFEALVARVVKRIGASSLILPGVKKRLAATESLSAYRPAWGIMTYGDEIDQRMKTNLIGMETVPFLLSDTPDKGTVVASWKLPDGRFQLPEVFGGGIVDCVTLEDDKLRAFRGLPDGALGFWVTSSARADELLAEAATQGIPLTVHIVHDISATTPHIKKAL